MSPSSPLGLAGRFAAAFIDSKLTPLIVVAAVLFGAIAISLTPRTYNPDIIVPVVNVTVKRPGSDARQMLTQVVRPLEALVAAVPGVDHTYGMARDDVATVTVRFDVGDDPERSLVKVYNQLSSNLDRTPPGGKMPLVQSVSLYDVPIVTVTFSSNKLAPDALRNVAAHVLDQLRNLSGVGKTYIYGTAARALRVQLDPTKLAAYGLTPEDVAKAIGAGNVAQNAGSVVDHGKNHPLRIDNALRGVRDAGSVVVAVHDGQPVLLRDVAHLQMGPENRKVESFYADGPAARGGAHPAAPAVTIGIARKKGSNGVNVADEVLARLQQVERRALPDDVHVAVTRNDGATADDAVNTLIEHLGIAIVTVVLILLIFLGWREAAVVTLSIPLILFVVLGVGWLFGQSINRITLFALILSLGLLVDDSIVVIENIHRHLHEGRIRDFDKLILRAADEIGKPTIIATLTVVLALIPMAFVTGMMGPFMAPIPFDAPVAMVASLLIAYSVVPYVSKRWLGGKAARSLAASDHLPLEEHGKAHRDPLRTVYLRLFRPLLRSRRTRWIFILVVVAMLLAVMLQPLWQFIRPAGSNGPLSALGVELKMLPNDNVNTFLVEIDMPAGTALEQTGAVADAVGGVLGRVRWVTDYQTFLGRSAPEDFSAMVRGDGMRRGGNFAQIRVNLVNKHDRSIESHAIARRVYAALAKVRKRYPTARIKLMETPPGPPVRSQMMAALYGPNYDTLRQLATQIRDHDYPRVYGMINVDDSVGADVGEYRVVVNRSAAALAGLHPAQVARWISDYFHGRKVGSVEAPRSLEPVPIVLRVPRPQRSGRAALAGLYLSNGHGKAVALSSIARVEKVTADKPIYTRDQTPVVYLSGNMLHSSPVNGVISLTQWLSGMAVGHGHHLQVGNLGFVPAEADPLAHYQLHWLGEMRLTLDVFRDLGAAFMVALVLIYLLLVGYYRSFMMPLVVMGAIPLTLIGIFPGHWIMGQAFTATSMIGFIALAGIVVRNSLLLIDFILENRAQGMSLEEAVTEAGAVRLRPIVLTALAIILGSAIMLSDPVFGGLAISLIFGAFASTALTLFVIPLLYYRWQRPRHASTN